MNTITTILNKKVSIAPLISFRIVFGLLLLYSTIRFAQKGWIHQNYIHPNFFFSFSPFLSPLEGNGMYYVFFILGVSSLFIALGFCYRFSTIVHFSLFTYVELLDKTYYLNHYYLVSLLLFWMIFVPANRSFSLDSFLFPHIKTSFCKNWHIAIFKIQLSIVYFFAGIAKINTDWLLRAQPLATWLPGRYDIPIIGNILQFKNVAYVFSWTGCIYDTLIWVFLWIKKTRSFAYFLVLIFHILTGILFPRIGMFPYIMICSTIIFFSSSFHMKVLSFFGAKLNIDNVRYSTKRIEGKSLQMYLVMFYLVFQFLVPFRYVLYSGNVFWNEKGYRFSWRVMLMEKNGMTSIILKDPIKNTTKEIDQELYLTPFQQQQMKSQPDMILQFSNYIGDQFYTKNGYKPEIYVKSRMSLNSRRSQEFTDSTIDVYNAHRPLYNNWIIPLKDN